MSLPGRKLLPGAALLSAQQRSVDAGNSVEALHPVPAVLVCTCEVSRERAALATGAFGVIGGVRFLGDGRQIQFVAGSNSG